MTRGRQQTVTSATALVGSAARQLGFFAEIDDRWLWGLGLVVRLDGCLMVVGPFLIGWEAPWR